MSGRFRILALLALPLLAGCGPAVDLGQAIQVTELSSGWFDGGIVDGKNKLVPSLNFRLRKATPDVDIDSLSLNIVFKQDGATDNWDDVFLQRVSFAADGQTEPLVVRVETGYRGDPPQSRLDMLKNSRFVDLQARIMAKQPSGQWVELQSLTIERRLLTR